MFSEVSKQGNIGRKHNVSADYGKEILFKVKLDVMENNTRSQRGEGGSS